MKTYTAIIISILFISTCFAQKDLPPAYPGEIIGEGENGIVAHFKGEEKPFTGILVDEKTNKKIGEYKDGYKNGMFTEYYSKGKKKSEGKYRNGVKDGSHTEWFENGQKEKEETYKDGKIIISSKYENGKLIEAIELLVGLYADGHKKSEGYIKNGEKEGMWTFYYEGGQKEFEGNYVKGKQEGLWTCYYEGGQKKSEGNYKDGNQEGLWVTWLVDERIKSKGNYINGKKDGEFIENEGTGDQRTTYYKNGEIDTYATNWGKIFKSSGNSKLFRVLSNNPNENVFVNLIIESNENIESNLFYLKNIIINDTRFQEIPESVNNTYKIDSIDYLLSYYFNFQIYTNEAKDNKTGNIFTEYAANLHIRLILLNRKYEKLDERVIFTSTDGNPTKENAISAMLRDNNLWNNNYEFINKYFPAK